MKVRKLLALIFFARKNLISTKFLQNQTLFWICHFCLLLLQWIKSGWPNKVRLIISRKLVGCQPQKGISVLLPCIALASNQNRVRHWPNSYVLGQHNKQHHQREVVFLRRRREHPIQITLTFNNFGTPAQFRNFKIFLLLRFYVKSILENLEVVKLSFLPF